MKRRKWVWLMTAVLFIPVSVILLLTNNTPSSSPDTAESQTKRSATNDALIPAGGLKSRVMRSKLPTEKDPGRIEGWVYSTEGGGVPDAEVVFIHEGAAIGAQTNSEGLFQAAPESNGVFLLVSIDAPGFLPYYSTVDSRRFKLVVTEGYVTQIELYLQTATESAGRVVDDQGRPVPHATVTVEMVPSPRAEWRETDSVYQVDAEGAFTFSEPYDVLLVASHPDFFGGKAFWTAVTPEPVTIRLRADSQGKLEQIAGVVRREDGQTVSDADVILQIDVSAVQGATRVRSEADGEFRFVGIPPGEYPIAAYADGYVEARDTAATGAENVELVLKSGVSLSGAVIEESTGEPVTSFGIEVFREETALVTVPVFAGAFFHPDGSFSVDGLRPGNYAIEASASDLAKRRVRHIRVSEGAEPALIALGPGASVFGTVKARAN